MARHLRVFAAARNATPTDRSSGAALGRCPLRPRPDADVPGPARGPDALRHLLGLPPADHRHGEHRDRRSHPGGPVVAGRRGPVGRDHGAAERRRRRRAGVHRLRDLPAGGRAAEPPHAQPARARHPGADRRGRGDRAARAGVRGRGVRRDPGRVRRERAGRRAGRPRGGRERGPVRRLLVGAHGRWSRSSCATCPSASTSTSPPRSPTSSCASSPPAASCPRWTSRPRTRCSGCGRSRTCPGRTCSTASPAPSAAAASRPARPTRPGSRSTPRRSSWASATRPWRPRPGCR